MHLWRTVQTASLQLVPVIAHANPGQATFPPNRKGWPVPGLLSDHGYAKLPVILHGLPLNVLTSRQMRQQTLPATM